MKIKNDLVRIKVGKKKYDFHNLILNEYLRKFALGQIDKENATSRNVYQIRDLSYILLKFDTPISELNENSEISNYDFDICIINRAKYSQNLSEKNVIVQYSYECKENDSVLDENIASQGGDSSTGAIKYLKEFYGRKIMAIGFAGHWWYKDPTPVCAVLDTSNYNIYLEENQEFSVTRRDIITTDAEFYSNDKDKVPAPVHLAPYGVPQIINQPDIVDSQGTINSFYNNAYGALYSIGKGYMPNVIEEEKIIGENAKVVNNGTSLTISSVENEDVGTEALYPSDDLYPIGKFTEEIQTSEKGVQVSIEGNEEDAFVQIDGKSTQATRSGKNLYSSVLNNSSNITVDNLDLVIDFSKDIDTYARLAFKKEVGKTYTFVFDGSGMADGESVTFYLEQSTQLFNFKNGKNVWVQNAIKENLFFTLDDRDRSNISSTITVSNIMILEGEYTEETIPEYEPYGVSPSPEFPSEIQSVGDEGTLNIEQSSSNLFNASKMTVSTISVLDSGKTIKMPIATSGNGYTHVGTNLKGVCPKLEVGDTVYLLGDTTSQKNKFIYLGGNSKFTWEFGKSRTLTENDLNAAFVLYGNNFEKGETEQVTISNLRIVKNASDKWEQYFNKTYTLQLSEPLRSLPNGTKDTIEEDGIHRRVRHLSLAVSDMNGSENYPGWSNLSQLKEDLGSNYNTPVFPVSLRCNILKDNTYLGLNTKASGSLFLNKSAFNLTQTEWKEQYPNLVVEIDYELSEEVVEPFTDEQLEVINSIETQKGTNIFSIDSELDPEIQVTEYKSPLYPIKDNYKYIILKYKVWQEVATGEYTEEDGYIQEITDTGYYYHQAIPLEEYGTLNTTIKYERG